ncbi:MAG: cytochrome c [Myxococcota bacterium]
MKRAAHPVIGGACALAITAALAGWGCQQKMPTAESDKPGAAPNWGQGFGTQQPQTGALMGNTMKAPPPSAQEAPAPGYDPTGQPAAPSSQPAQPGGGDLAARGLPNAGPAMPNDAVHGAGGGGGGGAGNQTGAVGASGTNWGGGDPALGQREFGNQCARCHGMNGKGGMVQGVGQVPDLSTAEFQARVGDAAIASVIAHGRNQMPSFAESLDGAKLRALVAYIRSLKGK